MIRFSFVIPVKEVGPLIREQIPRILSIRRDDFEILIYPDQASPDQWEKTRQIASGPVGPAEKRNLAIRDARGGIIIFLDDDAFPQADFLDVLEKDFSDPHVMAVGGPALTPHESRFWQRVSGAMFLSYLSGGFPERYRPVGRKRYFNDWPSVNLSIRKDIFSELGGFSCRYWPGEDTFLCYELLTRKNVQILYDPELIVFHHRRESLKKHLQQVSSYGLHRGFFVKKFSRTSLRWQYFMPSLLVLFILIGAIASLLDRMFAFAYLFGWLVYFGALGKAFGDIYRTEKSIKVASAAIYYIFLSHLSYGVRFLEGLFLVRELKSKLRE